MTDEFWSARPVLGHIRDFARSRRVSPFGVLGVTLVRASASVPPNVTLPPLVGGPASLNLFMALCGASGQGKGGSEAASADAVTFTGDPVGSWPIGSGPGLAKTFRPAGTDPDDDNPVRAAIFTAAEVDTLTALAKAQGSTLSAAMRSLFMAEPLGHANAGKETRNMVKAHSYRAGLIVGVQWLRSGGLLGDADGGLPQRFVFLPVSDPDAPDVAPVAPDAVTVTRPVWGTHWQTLDVPTAARDAVDASRLEQLRGTAADPLDGHVLLCRLKVAAALMALDGRTIVNDEDWQLSGHLMAVSQHTRSRCEDALLEHSRKRNIARAIETDERDEVTEDRRSMRCRAGILRMLSRDGKLTRGALLRRLKVDVRPYLDGCVYDLAEDGQVIISPGKSENSWDTVSLADTGTHAR